MGRGSLQCLKYIKACLKVNLNSLSFKASKHYVNNISFRDK